MAVRALDNTDDWTFGQGRSNYITKDNEIAQNVITRIRSFKNDYFLDTEANIDWINILGKKNNQSLILSEIRRVVSTTDGVQQINEITLIENKQRSAIILIDFDTIYNKNVLKEVGIYA